MTRLTAPLAFIVEYRYHDTRQGYCKCTISSGDELANILDCEGVEIISLALADWTARENNYLHTRIKEDKKGTYIKNKLYSNPYRTRRN